MVTRLVITMHCRRTTLCDTEVTKFKASINCPRRIPRVFLQHHHPFQLWLIAMILGCLQRRDGGAGNFGNMVDPHFRSLLSDGPAA